MLINNKILVELFASDNVKETYLRTYKVTGSMKSQLLNVAKNQYKIVEDLGRGKYNIDEKFDGSIMIPNNKMAHPIYGNLIPSILINVKNFHDNEKVFCLSLSAVYSNFKMIHRDNYCNMRDRRRTTSEILDVNYDTLNEFFSITNTSLKYYLDNSITLLENLRLIKCNKLIYVKLINSESVHTIGIVDSYIKTMYRPATKEEQQFIEDNEYKIKEKYGISKDNKLFGKPKDEMLNILKTINIEYTYECYEIICRDKKSINEICEFYSINKLDNYSNEFSKNFISMTIANAEDRRNEAIMNNLSDFYRFSESYIMDFMKLSEKTLDCNSDKIFIPKYKTESIEDGYGGISVKTTHTK